MRGILAAADKVCEPLIAARAAFFQEFYAYENCNSCTRSRRRRARYVFIQHDGARRVPEIRAALVLVAEAGEWLRPDHEDEGQQIRQGERLRQLPHRR